MFVGLTTLPPSGGLENNRTLRKCNNVTLFILRCSNECAAIERGLKQRAQLTEHRKQREEVPEFPWLIDPHPFWWGPLRPR